MSETLVRQWQDGVALLRLNRPDARNALDPELRGALAQALTEADADQHTGCIVLTGEGPAFCAGVDLRSLPETEAAGFESDPAADVAACMTPVVGAINGACIGGGLELALACDFVIAADSAVFADTHAALGYVATWGLYDRLPAAVGIRQATEICLSGRRIDAREAVALGLANRTVPLPVLLQTSLDCARRIAALEPSVRTEVLHRLRVGGTDGRP